MSYFNPHSRKGSDKEEMSKMTEAVNISIHTPARGVTVPLSIVVVSMSFQSTLPQGE